MPNLMPYDTTRPFAIADSAAAERVREQLATTVPATFLAAPPVGHGRPRGFIMQAPQPEPGAPCEAHAWCKETGHHTDHFSRRVALPTSGSSPAILTAGFFADEPSGVPELSWDLGHDNDMEFTSGDQLREQTAKVRAHLARLDALADEYDAIREAGGQPVEAANTPDPADIRRVRVEEETLGRGTAVLYKQYGDLLRVAFDPDQTTEAKARELVGLFVSPEAAALMADPVDGGEEPAALVTPPPATPRYEFQTVTLDADTPLALRYVKSTGRVHVGWDPAQITRAEADALFADCARDAGLDPSGVSVPDPATAVSLLDLDQPDAATDCANPASVRARLDRVAAGIVNAARIQADPRLNDPTYRVVPADSDDWFRLLHEAEVMDDASSDGLGGDAGIPQDAFHQRRLLALVQAYAQAWGSGHGRTLPDEYAAQLAEAAAFLAAEAVTVSLAGLETTNPHDTAGRLHRAVDAAQAEHLAKVGGHAPAVAYADSRFSSSGDAMADAMGATGDRAGMARALRTMLNMVISEATEQDGGNR